MRPGPKTLLVEPAGEEPLPASVGAGRYELIGLIGEGRHKRVCLGVDGRLERTVAVSLIKPEAVEELGQFGLRRELRIHAGLSDHRNVVTLYDGGERYFVSEYLAAGDLAALVAGAAGKRIPLGRVLAIVTDVARALGYAHGRRIVHRDVKPSNVWLARDGFAKLGDFGLACGLDDPDRLDGTKLVGTVSYMSPEQALGHPADQRSDLYSLGALTYELLCGRPPFESREPAGTLFRRLYTAPEAPSSRRSGIPPSLDVLVMALLAKEPVERPSSAGEVVAALEEIVRRPVSKPAGFALMRPVRAAMNAR